MLEYCEHHRGEPLPAADAEQNQDETRKRTTDISEWDQKFITVDQEMLFEIILAANYLDIKPLLYVLFPESALGADVGEGVVCGPLTMCGALQRCWMQDGRKHDQGQDP